MQSTLFFKVTLREIKFKGFFYFRSMRFEKYIFICLNERAEDHPRGCCSSRGAVEVFDEFKKQIKERKLRYKFRVNRAGCMECCEAGPSVMIHPDNVWYGNLKVEDVTEIIEEHIVGGKPVERLLTDFSIWKK